MLCPVLVGREEEVELLGGVLDDAVSGRRGIVLLTGEAGMGKFRLTKEAAALASARRRLGASGRGVTGTLWNLFHHGL